MDGKKNATKMIRMVHMVRKFSIAYCSVCDRFVHENMKTEMMRSPALGFR